MFRVDSVLGRVFCAAAVFVPVPSVGAADETPQLHDILSRSLHSTEAFADDTLGNGWTRTDRFTNVDSGQYSVRLDSVEWLFLNPEDLGYSDIANSNAWSVVGAAAARYPDYLFGASFWVNKNPPPMNWTNSGHVVDLGGIWLDPGAFSDLQTVAHNDIMGMVGPPSENWDLVGEVVVGWQFDGIVAPVPEPATMGLLAVGGLALIRRRGRA